MSASTLAVRDVTMHFGSLVAVDEVSLELAPGERRAMIGPNGAGKSTLFAIIAGLRKPTSGTVWLGDADLTSRSMHQRADRGVVTTFQHSSLFLRESALENVVLAALRRHPEGRLWPRSLARRTSLLAHARDQLEWVGLADLAATPADELSHGQRRQLELAIALAADPSVLLLDEPVAGMSRGETERFAALVRSLSAEVSILLVEHNLDLVWDLAERVTVLHVGRHLMTGTVEEVQASEKVGAAYLGEHDREDLFIDAGDPT